MTSLLRTGMLATALLILLIELTVSVPRPQKTPWETYGSPQHLDECRANGTLETFCQKCAKHTRSNIVYPMCCGDLEEARRWCELYMSYGRKE